MTGGAARDREPAEVPEAAPELPAGRDAQHRVHRPGKLTAPGGPDLGRPPVPAAVELVPARHVSAGAVPVTGNGQVAASSARATGHPRVAMSARAGGQLAPGRGDPRKTAGTAAIATPSPTPGGISLARKARPGTGKRGRALAARRPGVLRTGHRVARAVAVRPAGRPGTADPPRATATAAGPPAGLATTGARMVPAATTTPAATRTPAGTRTPVVAMTATGVTTAAGRVLARAGRVLSAGRVLASAASAGTAIVPTPGVHVQMRRDAVPGQSPVRRSRSRSAHCSSTAMRRPSSTACRTTWLTVSRGTWWRLALMKTPRRHTPTLGPPNGSRPGSASSEKWSASPLTRPAGGRRR